nr:N-acetylmuramidase domain-containing protein [uncultured Cohaesibacter sp.]
MFPISYLTRRDLSIAAEELGVSVAVIQAVSKIEARSSGFIKGTDLPQILFEGHKFSQFTNGRFDAEYSHISHKSWDKSKYKGGRGEYDRLIEAITVNNNDPIPALMSTSWGMFQIMGFNHKSAGFSSVIDLVNAISLGEQSHLVAFISFIKSLGLSDELQSKDWAEFAKAYNGASYKKNKYDLKLASAFSKALVKAREEIEDDTFQLERGDAVALQIALNVYTEAALVPDGWIGPKTITAIKNFQKHQSLEPTGKIDHTLLKLLELDHSAYLLEI